MKKEKKDSTHNGALLFAKESETDPSKVTSPHPKIKLLIVDDEKEVHVMTKLVLSDYSYEGSTLEFLSAYSGEEAKQLIWDHPDAACILLDVVMETNDAGLEVARFIREDTRNDKIRIILRTGQPGKAPEKEIILNYDINDYKEKTELTTQKLFTSITTALRSYNHLVELELKTNEIAEKNSRLNEEIARRIVAESNLTKYNRSLEKMIDSKSKRLKIAIIALEKKEYELLQANRLANVGDVSSASLKELDTSKGNLKENLAVMDKYRSDMTVLLEKYEILQNIIILNPDSIPNEKEKTEEVINEIDQLKKDIDFDEILKKYPEIIEDSTRGIEYISKAVNDIKLFISINEEKRVETDINALLISASNEIKSQFSTNIDLQTDFGTIPRIIISPENMTKAFREIIKNAYESVQTKGIISISTSFAGSFISIQISDIGSGIAKKHLKYVFKPYFSINKNNANGIGLSFAKSVLTDNKGTIDITSTVNEGTNLIIKFYVK